MTHHVVMFSGGLGSWATAREVLTGRADASDRLTLLFADVGGDNRRPHSGEDEDTYRFIQDAADDVIRRAHILDVHAELVTVRDGRDIWQVFKDDRFLGNSRLANCSKYLKQIPCRNWLDANADPDDSVVYVGIDWTETHRLPAIERSYLPYRALAPLAEPPYLTKEQVRDFAERSGLRIPRLYLAGFPHNNCGGGCVRAGQAQFALLLREHPERYRAWEANEQELRDHLDADVSILRDRIGGTSTPLTLRSFREGIEAQTQLFDPNDFGGCGCFVDDQKAG